MLMMLDIADALPLILERSDRRTELQIPTMLALLYARRSLWRRRDGYPNGFGPLEANPTGTVAITVLLAVSMTETVLEPLFVT
jgi:hypothetical protein